MSELLLSTTVMASFIGGVLALLAPCCVSVMLPAYFASTFQRRTQLLSMTLVFATGVGAVILPIALGASAISRLLNEQHALVFSIGGALMVAVGIAMLVGWKFMLPMPSAPRTGRGVGGVFGLGSFSGAASACCAPVLAGVVALSGATASFATALAIGVAYVFGMVAPLTVLALVWDWRDWGSARLLAARTVTLKWGSRRTTVALSTLLSAVLMIGMGVLTFVLALRGQGMATDGWQVRVTAELSHIGSLVEDAISVVPGWISTLLVFGALLGLVLAARRGVRRAYDADRTDDDPVSADVRTRNCEGGSTDSPSTLTGRKNP